MTFAHQGDVIAQNAGGSRYRRWLAFDFQTIVQQTGTDVQSAFDDADILVAGPEEGLNATTDLYAGLHSRLGLGSKTTFRERGGRNHICLHASRKSRALPWERGSGTVVVELLRRCGILESACSSRGRSSVG